MWIDGIRRENQAAVGQAEMTILEVVKRYLKLKRHGANYIGRCPFHSEKTPSFVVSPTKQFYHCFGCGAHGTVGAFLDEIGYIRGLKMRKLIPNELIVVTKPLFSGWTGIGIVERQDKEVVCFWKGRIRGAYQKKCFVMRNECKPLKH